MDLGRWWGEGFREEWGGVVGAENFVLCVTKRPLCFRAPRAPHQAGVFICATSHARCALAGPFVTFVLAGATGHGLQTAVWV